MLHFLYGKDNFRLLQREKELKESANLQNSAFLEEEILDLAFLDSKVFWDFFYQPSIFAENKIIRARNVLENPSFTKEFLKKAEELAKAKDIIILSQQAKDKLPLSFEKKLKQVGSRTEAFPLFSKEEIRVWAKGQVKEFKAEIDNKAIESLIGLCSSDLFCLSSEIKKLACFSSEINQKAIDAVSFAHRDIDIFSTLDSLSKKNKKEAISLLQNHLDKGESPLYLFSMIAFQIRNLLLVKNFFNFGANKLGMRPFVFKKLSFIKNNFQNQELENIFLSIFEIDYKIKTGKVMPEEALFDFVSLL